MTENADTTSTEGGVAATGEPVAGQPTPTVEDRDAFWQNRMSGKDKAHAAETAELRRQLDALRNPAASTATETPEQAQIRELKEALQRAEREKAVEARKARFPHVAGVLAEDVANVDEARLAALEALVAEEPQPAPRMDPNAAKRGQPAAPKAYEDMSVDELKNALRSVSPQYEDYLRSMR